jgi:CDP-diacylglycerol--serine O-phosphatidyltransferase
VFPVKCKVRKITPDTCTPTKNILKFGVYYAVNKAEFRGHSQINHEKTGMKKILQSIPSAVTSLGLLSGCISIVITTTRGDLVLAGYFILIAAVFDLFDGMLARILHSISEFGKQLDSLADAVSFGVAPAMILYRLLSISLSGIQETSGPIAMQLSAGQWILVSSAFLVAVFSALRLAKFNLDANQVKSFRGLPTPANALFIASLGFIAERVPASGIRPWVVNPYFLLLVIVLSCFLLVSNFPMFSFKFSSFGIKENRIQYLFIGIALLLLLIFGLPGMAGVIPTYILLSGIKHIAVKEK